MDPLDEYETKVLTYLCENRGCISSVLLACNLFGDTTFEWLQMEAIVRDLNEKGLLTYRLGEYSVYIHIKPVPRAYEVAGVNFTYTRVVGSHHHPMKEAELHHGDRTDFRFHGGIAQGIGGIERMGLEDHMAAYYDHADLHLRQLEEWWSRG